MTSISDPALIAGLADELEKIGFDTATAMEAIGIPAAMLMGYHHGGLRGAGISGLGAAGGLGAGMVGSHYVKKMTDSSPWMKRHPLVKAIAEAAPVGMGGIVGGTMGEHYANHRRPALPSTTAPKQLMKMSGALAQYLLKKVNPILALDAANDVGKIPERIRRYEEMLKEDRPHGPQNG